MTTHLAAPPIIVRVGARSPLGLNALQVAMGTRALKLEPRRTPLRDQRGQAVGMVHARFLSDALHGCDRLVALGAPALAEVTHRLRAPLPLLLGLPEASRPDDHDRYDGPILGELQRQSSAPIDGAHSVVVRQGHSSFAFALELAAARLAAGAPAVLVGAIDSYYHPDVIGWLDQSGRLHGRGTETGMIPSEGAAFVLLARAAGSEPSWQQLAPHARPLAQLRCVATHRSDDADGPSETQPVMTMTELVRRSVAAVPAAARWVMTDVNSERGRVHEWSQVERRCGLGLGDERIDSLPRATGDCGAATGALALGLACSLWACRAAPAAAALVALRSDGGARGAFAVEQVDGAAGAEDRAVPRRAESEISRTSTLEKQAREAARDADGMLQNALLSTGMLQSSRQRSALTDLLDRTAKPLRELVKAPFEHHATFGALDRARDAHNALREWLDEEGGDGALLAIRHVAGVVAEQLKLCRELSVDGLLALQRDDTDAQPEAARAVATELACAASPGMPSLHRLSQPSSTPPQTAVEASAVDDPISLDPGEIDHLTWMARDCLSEVAAFSTLRIPLADAPWTHAERFEHRLLATLDALLSLAAAGAPGRAVGWNVLDQVQRYGRESYVPDFGRQLAVALAHGSVEGDEPVRATLQELGRVDPAAHTAVRDGLALAPNPTIEPQISELLPASETALVPLLLDVLRLRRAASLPMLMSWSDHASLPVRCAVARSLAFVDRTDDGLATLQSMMDEGGNDELCLAAATCLLTLGDDRALRFVRARCARQAQATDSARYGFLRVLALAGRADDRHVLLAAPSPTARDAELAGWCGHVDLVERLLTTLQGANELRRAAGPAPHPLELAAVSALVRITAAPVQDEPRDDVPYDFANEPALRGTTWMSWWERHAAEFDRGLRYRFGQPYTPQATVEELWAPDTTVGARECAALELSFAVGPNRLETTDWVARQRLALADVRSRLAQGHEPYPPGAFIADQLARRTRFVG